MERRAGDKAFSELVGLGVVAPLNRGNESSLKLSSDNFCGCDLLPEHERRAASFDEPFKFRPEVPFVFDSAAFPCAGEWLARAASRPERVGAFPSGEPQGFSPSGDPGEEVALGISQKVICSNIYYAPFVNIPGGD
jgi:hypothetical protein